jgi:hypothetical protein
MDRRQNAPWDDVPDIDRHEIPYQNRWWYICARSGRFKSCSCDWDRSTLTARRVDVPKKDGQGPLSYQDLRAVLGECMKDDSTIAEAFIRWRGKDELPKGWRDRALRAPRVGFEPAESHAENISDPKPRKDEKKHQGALNPPLIGAHEEG